MRFAVSEQCVGVRAMSNRNGSGPPVAQPVLRQANMGNYNGAHRRRFRSMSLRAASRKTSSYGCAHLPTAGSVGSIEPNTANRSRALVRSNTYSVLLLVPIAPACHVCRFRHMVSEALLDTVQVVGTDATLKLL